MPGILSHRSVISRLYPPNVELSVTEDILGVGIKLVGSLLESAGGRMVLLLIVLVNECIVCDVIIFLAAGLLTPDSDLMLLLLLEGAFIEDAGSWCP